MSADQDDWPEPARPRPPVVPVAVALVAGIALGYAVGAGTAEQPAPGPTAAMTAAEREQCAMLKGFLDACDAGVSQIVSRLRAFSASLDDVAENVRGGAGAEVAATQIEDIRDEIARSVQRFDRIAAPVQ